MNELGERREGSGKAGMKVHQKVKGCTGRLITCLSYSKSELRGCVLKVVFFLTFTLRLFLCLTYDGILRIPASSISIFEIFSAEADNDVSCKLKPLKPSENNVLYFCLKGT